MNESYREIQQTLEVINSVILGKANVSELSLAALLAKGSILIEDRPGLGKTTLAKILARVIGLSFQRIQCTNDLLPMDILGRIDYLNRDAPRLIEGPIFSQIVLLDELNRAPPRTQSAFLQAMEEGEVTLEGKTFKLPEPQMFIATQNPSDQVGTALLPESELDRFTLRLSLGFPDPSSEKMILKTSPQEKISTSSVTLTEEKLINLQKLAKSVTVSDALYDLIVRFLNFARQRGAMLSPRAGRDITRMAQAMALVKSRNYALPEDVKMVLSPVITHRVGDADGLIAEFPFQA